MFSENVDVYHQRHFTITGEGDKFGLSQPNLIHAEISDLLNYTLSRPKSSLCDKFTNLLI